ncbi:MULTISPECIES: cupin domain-containing protein [unclassified Streptomyces]|jgi:quercetin dioxygenase-like cupin family protein|uniref:cupin domain-containing protein n=1 Tax=unclassified Streptomyces TaxID=2593676 RepID=UPI0033B1CF36
MANNAHVRHSGDGEAIWMLNGLYEVKASSDETNGAMTVMEMTVPVGGGPPPHAHPGTESVYVIEGTLRYHIGGETVEGGPGSFFHIPEGTLERFEPTSTVRMLITYTPGGIDKFFAEAGEPAQRRELPPQSDTPPDVDRIIEIAKRHGVQMQPMPNA